LSYDCYVYPLLKKCICLVVMNGMVVSLQILFVCIYCVDDNYFLLDVTYDIIE
jgi:hypothetical protein